MSLPTYNKTDASLGRSHLPPDSIDGKAPPAVSTTFGADGWELAEAIDDVPESANKEDDVGAFTFTNVRKLPKGATSSGSESSLPPPGHNREGTAAAAMSPLSPVSSYGSLREGSMRPSEIDPSTLWFDPSDVIMIVDGEH